MTLFKSKTKIFSRVVAVVLMFAWVFSGWPQLSVTVPAPLSFQEEGIRLSFPPSIPIAYAATTTIILTSNDDSDGNGDATWTVPSDWDDNANRIEVIGGGAGGKNGGNNGSGGGGGGAYASGENIDMPEGVAVTFNVDSVSEDTDGIDSFICNVLDAVNCLGPQSSPTVVGAQAGSTPTGNGAGSGAGGLAATSKATGDNQVKYDGGAGGAGDTDQDVGGGGGGAAGPKGPGGAGESTDGTTGVDGGGGGGGGGDGSGGTAEAGGIDGDGFGGDGPAGGVSGGDTAEGNNAGEVGVDGTGGGGGGADGTGSPGGQGGTGDGTASGSGWGAGIGAGGGGGGVRGNSTSVAGNAGNYGAGGGGGENGGGTGAIGIIVISYTPSSAVSPTVTTRFASNIGATTANLNGTKTGGDNAVEHGFAYGTDSTLVTVIATTTLGVLNSNISFSSSVSSLSADTTYYFRAYATSTATNEGFGIIRSFVTGNTTVTRKMRLFAGFTIKLISGRVILHQR